MMAEIRMNPKQLGILYAIKSDEAPLSALTAEEYVARDISVYAEEEALDIAEQASLHGDPLLDSQIRIGITPSLEAYFFLAGAMAK